MSKEIATALMALQSTLHGIIGQSSSLRMLLATVAANEEAEFIRGDVERLANALEVTEKEIAAVIESFTQKIIGGFSSYGSDE